MSATVRYLRASTSSTRLLADWGLYERTTVRREEKAYRDRHHRIPNAGDLGLILHSHTTLPRQSLCASVGYNYSLTPVARRLEASMLRRPKDNGRYGALVLLFPGQ